MLPTKAMRLKLGTLLAADDTGLAHEDELLVQLIKEDFVKAETLAIGDLVVADFTGHNPIEAGGVAPTVGLDPATDAQRITIQDPVGGWRWVTGDAVNLPQTIYGYALKSAAGVLLATEKLPDPVTLNAAGQEVVIGAVQLKINEEPVS